LCARYESYDMGSGGRSFRVTSGGATRERGLSLGKLRGRVEERASGEEWGCLQHAVMVKIEVDEG